MSQETMMTDHRTIAATADPVCGMTVDPEQARTSCLVSTYDDREYVFCGKGCFLEFRDDPETILAPGYVASM